MDLTNWGDKMPTVVYSKIKNKVKGLLPPQEMAIKEGLFLGKNIMVSAPTASGKTLIAEMAILNALSNGKKAIYIAPMRALISEKYEDFKNDYPDIKTALSMGDYTESDSHLDKYDVIFVSTEKLDSMLRNSHNYMMNVGCIVYDEIHLLVDNDRGPTLEFLIALNRKIFPSAQIIGLSATIANGNDIANWLDCNFVKSDFRPVKLVKKIYLNGELINGKRDEINNVDNPLLNIAIELLKKRKQALVFSQTKKTTMSNALALSEVTGTKLDPEEVSALKRLSDEVLHVLDIPTSQCEKLSEVIKRGVAFHHAGLLNKQRKLVENAFRNGLIKFIVATPTLAMGVNLPANTVIISSVYRYGDFGSEPLPALEIEQMLGRAGRPKYDTEGTAIIIAKNERDEQLIREKYFDGETEPIISKFNNEVAVRKYVLALIDMDIYKSENAVHKFFDELYISEFGIDMEGYIDSALDFLEEHGFIKDERGKLSTTPYGKLVNRLYLDPYTGLLFMSFIEQVKKRDKLNPFAVLHLLFCSSEFKFLRVTQSEFNKYEDESYKLELMTDQNIVEYDRYVSAIKMAHVIDDWINERNERDIEEEYKILPGEFYTMLESLRWLSYSLKEFFKALGARYADISRLSMRVKHGVKDELVPLIAIPEVGRVRARRMYSRGIRSFADAKSADLQLLSSVLGDRIGKKVYMYFHAADPQKKLI
jgi:helicase